MKAVFSLAALVIALGLSAMLVKKQLGAVAPPPAVTPAGNASANTVGATPADQVQQVGQQVQALMQQARPAASEP